MNRAIMDRQMFRDGGVIPMQYGGMAPPPMAAPPMAAPPMAAPPMAAPPMAAPPMAAPPQDMGMSGEDEQMLMAGLSGAQNVLGDLDAASNVEEAINAIRQDAAPLEARRNELAEFVGPEDAARTPDSVLLLLQPVIIMEQTSPVEDPIDAGVGGLAAGAMDAPVEGPMAEGIMSTVNMDPGPEAPMEGPPVNFNRGGSVRLAEILQGRRDTYRDQMGATEAELEAATEAARNTAEANILFDAAAAGLNLAAGPVPGGSVMQNLAAAFSPVLANVPGRSAPINEIQADQKKYLQSLDLAALSASEAERAAALKAENEKAAAILAGKAKIAAANAGRKPPKPSVSAAYLPGMPGVYRNIDKSNLETVAAANQAGYIFGTTPTPAQHAVAFSKMPDRVDALFDGTMPQSEQNAIMQELTIAQQNQVVRGVDLNGRPTETVVEGLTLIPPVKQAYDAALARMNKAPVTPAVTRPPAAADPAAVTPAQAAADYAAIQSKLDYETPLNKFEVTVPLNENDEKIEGLTPLPAPQQLGLLKNVDSALTRSLGDDETGAFAEFEEGFVPHAFGVPGAIKNFAGRFADTVFKARIATQTTKLKKSLDKLNQDFERWSNGQSGLRDSVWRAKAYKDLLPTSEFTRGSQDAKDRTINTLREIDQRLRTGKTMLQSGIVRAPEQIAVLEQFLIDGVVFRNQYQSLLNKLEYVKPADNLDDLAKGRRLREEAQRRSEEKKRNGGE
jgi:hypothetical protein